MTLYNIGISCLSINRFKKSERNNILSAEARRILSILADSPTGAITTDKNDRPFFDDGNMDFNISHSGTAVAVSLVQGENINGVRVQTGCDIQLIRPREYLRNIAEEIFCAAEKDYILSQEETQLDRFFQIWTLKECYIKLKGLSVFDMSKAPSFIFCDTAGQYHINFNLRGSPPLSFYLNELVYAGERYMLAAAIEGNRGIHPEICMFSYPAALLSR